MRKAGTRCVTHLTGLGCFYVLQLCTFRKCYSSSASCLLTRKYPTHALTSLALFIKQSLETLNKLTLRLSSSHLLSSSLDLLSPLRPLITDFIISARTSNFHPTADLTLWVINIKSVIKRLNSRLRPLRLAVKHPTLWIHSPS